MAGELGFDTGPFVGAALFCEKVLQEKDGVLSLIRVVDRITVSAEGPEAPDEIPYGVAEATLLLILRAGQAKGAQKVRIRLERPDGSTLDGPEISTNFTGIWGGGQNLILPVAIEVISAGTYVADVLVNDRLVTRVPLQIDYSFIR